jgi:hypothetical protein
VIRERLVVELFFPAGQGASEYIGPRTARKRILSFCRFPCLPWDVAPKKSPVSRTRGSSNW